MQIVERRVFVKNVVPKKNLNKGDLGIPGVYLVYVNKKITPGSQVAAILDLFNNQFTKVSVKHRHSWRRYKRT